VIRPGKHPKNWKAAKETVIPKPEKSNYSLTKIYRVISLLNCLGKLTEEVVANMMGKHCESHRTLHPGQYGCRRGRSAVDAVGTLIQKTGAMCKTEKKMSRE
jgi:hypothetical protein